MVVMTRRPTGRFALRLLAALGLAVDAYVHLDLAGQYTGNVGSGLSQATVFRVEAVVAIVAAVLAVATARRVAQAAVLVVAGSAVAAVLLYRYVDIGAIGPLPDMYEPAWYAAKTISAVAEGIAAITAVLTLSPPRRWLRRGQGR